jgi:hypothetical protein
VKEPPIQRQCGSPGIRVAVLLLSAFLPGPIGSLGATVVNSGSPSTTTIASSTNPARTGAPVTLTASVKDQTLQPITTGTVTFTENGLAPAGTVGGNNVVSVSAAGHATFTTSSLPEGDHQILATFNSASFNSSSQSLVQREDNTATVSRSGFAYTYCNSGAIVIPAGSGGPSNIGAARPNPSNIFVTNLPGTIQSVGVTLKNFFTSAAGQISSIDSLLVGPGATNANTLDFFSGTGGSAIVAPASFTFSDNTTVRVPQSAFAPGTYLPTSYTGADTFSASTSGFFTLPGGIYHYANPAGTTTFAAAYSSQIGNGTWSLYFDQRVHADNSGVTGGWCLDFVENTPQGTASMAHIGGAPNNHFRQGEQNAQLTLTVVNNGPGPTGDPDGNDPLVVVGTLPAGLTAALLPTGSPWNCSSSSGLLTCEADGVIAASGTFPLLTIPVNVSPVAPATATVQVSLSGDGMPPFASQSDTVTIDPAPILAVMPTHSGTFTQGQTATWNIAVSNVSGSASGATDGSTVTMSDALPTGFTLQSSAASGWSCGGTTTVICTTTAVVAGGSSFNVISLTVNVPTGSPSPVTNTAKVFGGGDISHTSLATAASGSDTATVAQVPALITINGSAAQAAQIHTAFGSLAVTVRDAANIPIPNYSPVTLTAPVSGASGLFSNGLTTFLTSANGSGIASPGTFTANAVAGAYILTVTAGSATEATFSLTNTTPLDFFTLVPCRLVDTRNPTGAYGGPAIAPGEARTFTIVGQCGVSLGTEAVALNVTVPNAVASGGVRLFTADLASPPDVDETLSFSAGQTRANNAVLLLGQTGALTVQNDSASPVNVIIDVNGEFE